MNGLENLAAVITSSLAEWDERDRASGATVEQIQASNAAMAACDDLVAAVYRIRQQLVTERRADADQRAARADALLAEIRARREAGQE